MMLLVDDDLLEGLSCYQIVNGVKFCLSDVSVNNANYFFPFTIACSKIIVQVMFPLRAISKI